MYLIFTIVMLLLGILGASSLIGAESLAKKLQPIQGYLGVVGFVVGMYWLIQSILHLNTVGFMAVVTAGTMTALGLIMGISILKAVISESVAAKLSPYQGILGVVAIVLAVLALIS
jgi:hypothetical protein